MKQKQLQLMAYIPKTTTIKLHYVGFPAHWKEKLAQLASAAKADYDYERVNLPLCAALRKICTNWVHGLVDIASMRKGSDDSKWIVCLHEIDDKMCKEICVNLKIAAWSFYYAKLLNETAKKAYEDFLSVINDKELLQYVGSEEVGLINKCGKIASPYAYSGFCLNIKEKLCKQEVNYDGLPLQLYPSGQKELMSQILNGPKGDLYAYVFQLSLQTIPPNSKPMLLLHCSRRSFKNTTKKSQKYFRNDMTVFVKHKSDRSYYRLSITNNGKEWDATDKRCYDSVRLSALPEATELMNSIEHYNSESCDPRILCTISSVNSFGGGRKESRIGKGISNKDRQLFYHEFYRLMQDSVNMIDPIDKIKPSSANLSLKKDLVDFSKVISAIGYRGVKIEICSYDVNRRFANKIKEELDKMLSVCERDNDFSIETEWMPLGSYADPIPASEYLKADKRKERIFAISEKIEPAKSGIMTGSIVVLPREEAGKGRKSADTSLRDVKDLLRCGFALAGKVTQFINPDECTEGSLDCLDNSEDEAGGLHEKIKNTIYDLLRQFGYSRSLEKETKALPTYPVVAIGAYSSFNTILNKRVRALPIVITYDVVSGSIKIECPIIRLGAPVSYYEACLELVRLSMENDFERMCGDGVRRFTEMKLKALENYYRDKDAIVLVSGDGFMRNELWPGISNKRIEGYSFNENGTDRIDIGSSKLSIMFDFGRSKLRIVRMRFNDEVPDYYLDDGNSTNAGKGYYMYDDVYYVSVPIEKKDLRYALGGKNYSKDTPHTDYCSKKLIEYFPLRLCGGDDAFRLVNYLNELRKCSIQYQWSTNRPLPLHYIETLKEYVDFD